MIKHLQITNRELHQKIKEEEIIYGGNSKLKIYGTLRCKSGRRLKKENRVFFTSLKDVETHTYRPCGHCMRIAYKNWKNGLI